MPSTAIAAAPLIAEVRTRAGLTLIIRCVARDDEPLLEEFFERVSAQDLRFRFLSAHRHVGHEQIAPMVEVDHFRSEGFIALDADSATVVGHAMLACDNPLDTAEVAIAVCSAWRGKGVGWALLDTVTEAARQRGVRRVIAIESRDNHAAVDLEREKGFVPHGMDGEPGLVLLEKLLR